MRRLSVRLPAALLYLFIAVLTYLAGIYVAHLYYFVYVLMMLLPILSVVQMAVTFPALDIDERLDIESPTRGATVRYRITITNRSIFPSGRVRITFAPVHPEMAGYLPEITLSLPGHGRTARELPVLLPYRGHYSVGIDSVVMEDLFGWLVASRRVRGRSFAVYPRRLAIDFAPVLHHETGGAAASSARKEGDLSLFEGLSPYRSGFPAKQIAWKKFLSTGTPFLKDYGASQRPGVTIYLDMRRLEPATSALLEAEDSSIEIALALYRSFLALRQPSTMRIASADPSAFSASGPEGFRELYGATVALRFEGALSPVALYESDRAAGGAATGVVFVSHLFDEEMLTLVGASNRGKAAAVINVAAMSPADRSTIERRFGYLGNGEGRLLLIEGARGFAEAGGS